MAQNGQPDNDPHSFANFFANPYSDVPVRGIGGVVKTSVWDPPKPPAWDPPPSLVVKGGGSVGYTTNSSDTSSSQWCVTVADGWGGPPVKKPKKSVALWDFLEKFEADYQTAKAAKCIPGSKARGEASARRRNALENDKPSNKQAVFVMEPDEDSPDSWTSLVLPPGNERIAAWSAADKFFEVVFNEWANTFLIIKGLFDDVDEKDRPIVLVRKEIWDAKDGFGLPDTRLRPYLLHPEWKKRHPTVQPTTPTTQPPQPPSLPPPRSLAPHQRGTHFKQSRPPSSASHRSYRPPPSQPTSYRPRYGNRSRSRSRRSMSPRRRDREPSQGQSTRPSRRSIPSRLPSPHRRIDRRRSRSPSRPIANRSRSPTREHRPAPRTPPLRTPSPRTPPPRTPPPRASSPRTPPSRARHPTPTLTPPPPASSPLTELSSLSDENSETPLPATPREEPRPPSGQNDGVLDGIDEDVEILQPGKQDGVPLSNGGHFVLDPVEPFAPEDVEMNDDVAPDEPAPATPVEFDPFTEFLYFRFGFTHTADGPPYSDLESWSGSLSDEEFNAILAKFNYRDTVFADADFRKAAYHFTQPFLARVDPPPALWDLMYTNPRSLVRNAARVTVSNITEVESRPLYSLRSGAEEFDWMLIVTDPSVAVECLRRELLSTHDIMYFFLRRGTPFIIGHEGASSTLADDSESISKLPWGFQPDLAHFEQWETACRAFLVSPRGHLVWRLGGLYWRIALYILGTVPGPQDQIEYDTGVITLKLCSGLYEEPLTNAEIATVIGLSQMDSPHANAAPMRNSYFPHPTAAEGTSVLSSVWTPLNEEWFLAHLESIRHGGPGWLNQNAWRRILRGATTAHPANRRLEGYNRKVATEWLKL